MFYDSVQLLESMRYHYFIQKMNLKLCIENINTMLIVQKNIWLTSITRQSCSSVDQWHYFDSRAQRTVFQAAKVEYLSAGCLFHVLNTTIIAYYPQAILAYLQVQNLSFQLGHKCSTIVWICMKACFVKTNFICKMFRQIAMHRVLIKNLAGMSEPAGQHL